MHESVCMFQNVELIVALYVIYYHARLVYNNLMRMQSAAIMAYLTALNILFT